MGDSPAYREVEWFWLTSKGTGGDFYGRTRQEISCWRPQRQQRPDFALQGLVTRAYLAQKRVALFGRSVQDRLQHLVNLFPSFRVHR
jgi:hypothetical protein